MSTPELEPLMTAAEVADIFRVSEATLTRWFGRHIGPPRIDLEGIPRYARDDVAKYISERKAQ